MNSKKAEVPTKTKAEKKAKAEPRVKDIRRPAVQAMRPKVRKIGKKLAEMAEAGNCQAAKLVFEMLGIFPAGSANEEDGDDTLARYLLRELGIPDHPSEEEITKVLNGESEANAGAVKSS
jgi:hypothetical protein